MAKAHKNYCLIGLWWKTLFNFYYNFAAVSALNVA
jgi:hypothetical protein